MKTALAITIGALVALGSAPAARADDAAVESLMKKSNCFKCHAVDKKKDGPPYKEVAAKYKGKPDAEAKLYTHLTTNPKVKVKAALVEGRPVPASALETLASMPSRPELVAKLLGLMQSPVRRLVTVLSSPQRKLAMTISAVAEKKGAAA